MNRPRLNAIENDLIQSRRNKRREYNPDNRNVLLIGDIHEPFTLDGYMEFCWDIYNKYECNEVVFTGDIIDNHYSSFHVQDPDGFGAGEELERAIDKLADWYELFPRATVCLGNHDRIPARKAMDAGISSKWLSPYAEVLGVPNWDFVDSIIIDEVLYVHGDGASHAAMRSKKDLMSIAQGHFHSRAYIEWIVGKRVKLFAVQAPCGVDDKAYAMAYGKNSPKSAIGCTVILNNGTLPIIEMMEL